MGEGQRMGWRMGRMVGRGVGRWDGWRGTGRGRDGWSQGTARRRVKSGRRGWRVVRGRGRVGVGVGVGRRRGRGRGRVAAASAVEVEVHESRDGAGAGGVWVWVWRGRGGRKGRRHGRSFLCWKGSAVTCKINYAIMTSMSGDMQNQLRHRVVTCWFALMEDLPLLQIDINGRNLNKIHLSAYRIDSDTFSHSGRYFLMESLHWLVESS